MTASGCVMTSDVFYVCLTHAMSTEQEEVMGLLIGDLDENSVAHVSALVILERSDKRPDRCEISPEQLSDATTFAETLTQRLGRPMRVIGWYHSHPHITVWPSHVDVRTQAGYQMMDSCFVGVIFSVFNMEKANMESQIQVTCFQSVRRSSSSLEYSRIEIPFHIEPRDTFESQNLDSLVSLPKVLLTEESRAYQATVDSNPENLVNQVYNNSVFTMSLCHIMDTLMAPLMKTLENRLELNKLRRRQLEEEKQDLMEQIAGLKEDKSASPFPSS